MPPLSTPGSRTSVAAVTTNFLVCFHLCFQLSITKNMLNSHILQGSNTLTFCSPSSHFCTALGAKIRRSKHQSKVISVSHIQPVIYNLVSLTPFLTHLFRLCRLSLPWEWPELLANRNAQRTHATSPRMVKAPIGHPPHMAGTSPLEEPPGYYAYYEPLAWSQWCLPQNHKTEDQEGSTRDVASSATYEDPGWMDPA